jgi:hypothetical protein
VLNGHNQSDQFSWMAVILATKGAKRLSPFCPRRIHRNKVDLPMPAFLAASAGVVKRP